MRIVVTLRETKISKIKETRESIDKKLISLLIKNGLTPILIPSELGTPKNYKKLVSFLKLSRPSGLLLSGGEDIKLNSARYYLERKLFTFVDTDRSILCIYSIGGSTACTSNFSSETF